MSFAYRILASPLHATADAAIAWFMNNWGISKASVTVEDQINPAVELRPTFSAKMRDSYVLCIEVSQSVYANHLNACVLTCMQLGLPVKLFVAVPKDTRDTDYGRNIKAAKRNGVGVIEVDNGSGLIIQNALSLSLNALRPIEVTQFPKRYRHALSHAEQVFRDGAPEKGCSLVYDEIESLFRKIVSKTESKGYWPNGGNLNVATVAWATLITNWDKHLDRAACKCPKLTPTFCARILGITAFRNQSGHKPKTLKQLKQRDQQLRTRFEDAVDLFRDLVEASRPLKV